MPAFDYAPTNVTRYLPDGSRADIIHCIVVTGPENLRVLASDFPICIAGVNIPNSKISSLANSASVSVSGEPRANLVEETDPGLHGQVDSRGGGVGNDNLSFRWHFLSNVPAKRYLYWGGPPATRYTPKSCLVFLHQAEPTVYQFNWEAIARGSVVYLFHGDGKVEGLTPGDPIVTGITFTSLGEPLDDVTGLGSQGLVTLSPGCYQADFFIHRLMGMNGFECGDGFDISKDEALPLLLEVIPVSKENISFCKNNSLASHQDSNPNDSQPTIYSISNAGARDALNDKPVTGTGGLGTAGPSNGNGITNCAGRNETSNDQGIHVGGAGISVLTSGFAALQHLNLNPFARAGEVMPLYPSVFSPGEQISVFNEGGRREVCVESPGPECSVPVAFWAEIPQGTYNPRPPPFIALGQHQGKKRANKPSKFPRKEAADKWPPRQLIKGFESADSGFRFSDLELFMMRVGGVRNWSAFPPVQVAVEFLPKELKHLDWAGREDKDGKGDEDGKQDSTLEGSSPPIDEGTRTGESSGTNTGP